MRSTLLLGLTLSCLLPVLTAQSYYSDFEDAIATCTRRYDVTEDYLLEAWRHEKQISETGKCTTTCLYQHVRLLEPNGQLNVDRLIELLGPFNGEVLEAITRCRNIPGVDICNSGYNVIECLSLTFSEP
ncbi:hypothetical protein KR222_000100 [Zaprionus bogoriensis]|nr:hypothetical protein KR222_000100 [Zaprionus bogoriensis]